VGARPVLRLCAAFRFPRLRVRGAVAASLGVAAGVAGVVVPWTTPLQPLAVHADSTFDQTLFSLFNQDRANNGLPPLQLSSSLTGLAETAPYSGCGYTIRGRAEDMIERNYLSHTILNCGDRNVFDMMQGEGVQYRSAAENIGYTSGMNDPVAAAQWMNNQFMASSVHAANILDPKFNYVGIGSFWTASGQTWSGAGSPQSDVLVAATDFIEAPSAPSAAPPPSARPRTSAPAPVRRASTAPHAAASTPSTVHLSVAAPPAVAAAPPETGIVGPAPEAAVVLAQAHVSTAGRTGTPKLSLEMTCAGAVIALLASLRGLVARRRRGALAGR
jgi:uncharacterized protein YkwD